MIYDFDFVDFLVASRSSLNASRFLVKRYDIILVTCTFKFRYVPLFLEEAKKVGCKTLIMRVKIFFIKELINNIENGGIVCILIIHTVNRQLSTM